MNFDPLTNEVVYATVNKQLTAYLSEPFLHATLNGTVNEVIRDIFIKFLKSKGKYFSYCL